MASNWQTHAVADLISASKLEIGDGYRAKNSELADQGLPFARAGNLKAGFDFSSADRVPPDTLARVGAKRSQPGDVVFTSKGTVGRFAFVDGRTEPFVFSPQLCYWRVLDPSSIDPRFLFFWFHGKECERQLNQLKGQTDMADYVSLRDQRTMSITLPPIAEQRAIASALGAMADKGSANERVARSMERVAEVLFERLTLASHNGGGTKRTLKDLARYINGRNFTKNASGQGRMVVRIAELNSGPGNSTVWADVEANEDNVARPGDILFAWSGSLDVYRWFRDEALVNQHIFKVIPDGVPPWFVFFHLRRAMPVFRGIAADKATTMGHIRRQDLETVDAPIPNSGALAEADRSIGPLYEASLALLRENQHLLAIQKEVVPRLVSGTIRVEGGLAGAARPSVS